MIEGSDMFRFCLSKRVIGARTFTDAPGGQNSVGWVALLLFGLLMSGCRPSQVPQDSLPAASSVPSATNPSAAQNTATEDEPLTAVHFTATSNSATATQSGREEGGNPAKHAANRLAKETSPYLLLHAHNPVDWYPWGPEALEKAKREGKLIFLSVGYSSCHWCHVMEREAFSDPEIAKLLNQSFVCIKVDREERPDVDQIYMTSLYVFNELSGVGGGGGWPLSMFLTPEAKPFFGGTYLPARDGDRGVQTGFLTLLQRIQKVWKDSPAALRSDADRVTEVTQLQLAGNRPNPLFRLENDALADGLESLTQQFDRDHGGFGFNPEDPQRPKFPEPSNLVLLLEQLKKDPQDAKAREMLVTTLDHLYQGGIYDQLAGGFHRYSVDRFWHIPHFEKMLYDNAQLISVFAQAYELTGNPDYRRVVEETVRFLENEMRDESGAYWSALDADSEDEEGKFYRWTAAELRELLKSDEEWAMAAATWGVGGEPNFEERDYVLLLSRSQAETAQQQGLELAEWLGKLQPLQDRLLEARGRRERPLTDTKILTSWNGLAIRGLADASRCLQDPALQKLAERVADAVLEQLLDDEGRLYRTQGQGQPVLKAYVDDYANLIDGLVALHECTGEQRWLDEAERLMTLQLELFWDEAGGGFYFTADDHESLLARAKNPVDNVIPSGNSISALNLIYLGVALERPQWLDRAEATLRSVSTLMQQTPSAVPRMLIASERYLQARPERAGQTSVNDTDDAAGNEP
jgi:uncharacterized protein YyaL (SSP411 family)